jgi:hypothetical protein
VTRQGVICFKFYITRRFSSRFFDLCAVGMVGMGFSGVVEWGYPGVGALGRSGGAVVVVSISKVLLSC